MNLHPIPLTEGTRVVARYLQDSTGAKVAGSAWFKGTIVCIGGTGINIRPDSHKESILPVDLSPNCVWFHAIVVRLIDQTPFHRGE